MAPNGNDEDFWLFGYGYMCPMVHVNNVLTLRSQKFDMEAASSLCASQDTSKVIFADFGNEDHRGTPEAPGRVVTLIDRAHYDTLIDHHFSAPDERVWGAAYHIIPSKVAEVKDYLDIREINGYSIQYTTFKPAASEHHDTIKCLVYIGLPDNPQFMGPQDPQILAEHILRSKGPSGQNREYLYMLKEALDGLGEGESEDVHIKDLAARCQKLEAGGGWEVETGSKLNLSGTILHKVGSTEEQEEVEKVI